MKNKKIYYYSDDFDQDFFGNSIEEKKIDKNYKYLNNNIFYLIISFIYYYIMFLPIAFVYCKCIKKIKYENKVVLKDIKNTGYIVYANHTHNLSDAFSPSIICKNKPHIIVNAKNLNIPILKSSTKMLGAMPLPTGIDATKNFISAIKTRIGQKKTIIVYPEARLWPYYTDIRPFKAASFKYPIMFDVPAFCFTTTYVATKRKNKYKMIIYIDGPFYADKTLNSKQQQEKLQCQIFEKMKERSQNSNFEKIVYMKKEKNYY